MATVFYANQDEFNSALALAPSLFLLDDKTEIPDFKVQKSKIPGSGSGVFMRRAAMAHEVLMAFPGKENDLMLEDNYSVTLNNGNFWVVEKPHAVGHYINSSSYPNCILVECEQENKKYVSVVTLVPLKKSQELYLSYYHDFLNIHHENRLSSVLPLLMEDVKKPFPLVIYEENKKRRILYLQWTSKVKKGDTLWAAEITPCRLTNWTYFDRKQRDSNYNRFIVSYTVNFAGEKWIKPHLQGIFKGAPTPMDVEIDGRLCKLIWETLNSKCYIDCKMEAVAMKCCPAAKTEIKKERSTKPPKYALKRKRLFRKLSPYGKKCDVCLNGCSSLSGFCLEENVL